MSLNLSENEFTEKYGFALHDFYYSCIDEIINTGYSCYSIPELAYDLASKIYKELNDEKNEASTILYKLTEDVIWGTKIYTHNIAIPYKDLYITFEIGWGIETLKIKDWDMIHKEEIEKDKQYEDIDCFEEEIV